MGSIGKWCVVKKGGVVNTMCASHLWRQEGASTDTGWEEPWPNTEVPQVILARFLAVFVWGGGWTSVLSS